jgi:hypothetical protein
MKMEAVCSSETLNDFQRAAQCYIAEDRTLHTHHCNSLKAYIGRTVQKLQLECLYRSHGDLINLFFRSEAGGKMDVKEMGVNWIHLAQDRIQWKAVVNMVT